MKKSPKAWRHRLPYRKKRLFRSPLPNPELYRPPPAGAVVSAKEKRGSILCPTSGKRAARTAARFLPYLMKYKAVLFLDLFCAALTTPVRYCIAQNHGCTDQYRHRRSRRPDRADRSAFGRPLLCAAPHRRSRQLFHVRYRPYYGSYISRPTMRRDAFDHLLRLDHTYYTTTPRWARSWGASPMTCLM